MHEKPRQDGTAAAERSGGWRGARVALGGVAALALLLAAESLGASLIFDVSLRYPGVDKIGHVLQYGLVFLCVWWLTGGVVHRRAPRLAMAATVALLLGLGDELFQRLFAERTFDLGDLAANILGVALGIGLGPVIPSRRLARGLVAATLIAVAGIATHEYLRLRHFNRGLMYTRQGDLPKALAEYRLALRDGLDSPAFYNELAWIELESGVGDVHAAVRYASRALSRNPRNPDVLDTYGWALYMSGRSREALPPLEQALAGKPRMYCIHYHLGEVYAALGDRDRAAFYLREQIRLFPGGPDARRAAQALRRQGLGTGL
jgi:tetratricopeptide (TPR) repeat protein